MEKILDLIQWYEENANNTYDDMTIIELEKIVKLYKGYEDHTDQMFVYEMMESFLKVIEFERNRRQDLLEGLENEVVATIPLENRNTLGFVTYNNQDTIKEFQTDKQLQDAFTAYCLNDGKSTYTANDYCTRIRNVWKKFISEYQKGILPEEIIIMEERIIPNNPLLNAYNFSDVMNCYISMNVRLNNGNRNWANARAAYNKFDDFKQS